MFHSFEYKFSKLVYVISKRYFQKRKIEFQGVYPFKENGYNRWLKSKKRGNEVYLETTVLYVASC